MKDRYVVFNRTNARVAVGQALTPSESVLKNPDLSRVRGVAPHYWKPGPENTVIPMSQAEALARDLEIGKVGVDTSLGGAKARQGLKAHHKLYLMIGAAFALGVLIGYLI